jgi:hypothetical protein
MAPFSRQIHQIRHDRAACSRRTVRAFLGGSTLAMGGGQFQCIRHGLDSVDNASVPAGVPDRRLAGGSGSNYHKTMGPHLTALERAFQLAGVWAH